MKTIYKNCCECHVVFTIPANNKNKSCCTVLCSNKFKNKILKEKSINTYMLNPKLCTHCKTIIPYDVRNNKFCNHSCSASHVNGTRPARSQLSKNKTSNKLKGNIKKCNVAWCSNCNKYMPDSTKRICSAECLSAKLSNSIRGKSGGNRDINLPGVDCAGNKFYYDSGWEITLAESLTKNNIYWLRPKKFILLNGRSYTPDFYLPDYKIYIDPKAKRPNYYRNSILKIEMFEDEYNVKCYVISDNKLLSWGHLQTLMLVQTFRS